MFTIEEAKKWANEHSQKLDADRLGNKDETVQMLNRMIPEKSKSLWDSSCWLANKLKEHGATDEQISSIQMAHGQRSFADDSWQVAVYYVNEFSVTGDTKEKGGIELANKINDEIFG